MSATNPTLWHAEASSLATLSRASGVEAVVHAERSMTGMLTSAILGCSCSIDPIVAVEMRT